MFAKPVRRKSLGQNEKKRVKQTKPSKVPDIRTNKQTVSQDDETNFKTIINSLVKPRKPIKIGVKKTPKIKIVAEYENEKKSPVETNIVKTHDVGVIATSKDIDIFFLQRKTDNSTGDHMRLDDLTAVSSPKLVRRVEHSVRKKIPTRSQ